MVNFYSNWEKSLNSNIDDDSFYYAFLNNKDEVKNVTNTGNSMELIQMLSVLEKVDFNKMLELAADIGESQTITPFEIPCYSNFDNGMYRLNEILEFAPGGLTYMEIGYQLVQSHSKGAREKYGENHSKLAAMASLVSIERKGKIIVTNTALGSYFSSFSIIKKDRIIKLLLLQNQFIQYYLAELKNNQFKYRNTVVCLSDSTAARRRNNVRVLLRFLLQGTNFEQNFNSIDWQV